MTSSKTRPRYRYPDIWRLVCACFVIFIHVPFPSYLQLWFDPLLRTAVPFFLFVTGFFYPDTIAKQRQGATLKKVLFLLGVSSLFYLLWDLFPLLLMGKDALFSYCSALAPVLLFGCSLCAGIVCRFCLHLFQTWLTRRHTVETK